METVLIVDDEPVQRRLLENAVQKMGHSVCLAQSGEEALAHLSDTSARKISVVVLDLMMPGTDGMAVLQELNDRGSDVPVIVQTAQGGIDTVVTAIRAGAVDFCVKPVSPQRLGISIQNALKLGAMEKVVTQIRKTQDGHLTFDDMIASSPAMRQVVSMGQKAATSNIPVLIEGESGVGKEVVARSILGSSDRRGKPFITVNCGALPENLVESILFGHEKGAFTGAASSHVGKFKEADGGTLFLDEVGELPLDIQVKLLRALQEGEVDPVGAKRPVKTDFRLISATNRNMMDQVERGEFREDLYYRLSVFPMLVPPLRERKQDIEDLVKLFTARFCLEEGRRKIAGISSDALAMLKAYDWPGNIRQLENAIFRAVILCEGEHLTVQEFPQIAQSVGMDPSLASVAGTSENAGLETPVNFDIPNTLHEVFPADSNVLPMVDPSGDVRSLENIEADMIRFAISHHKGRMTSVARSLGIGRSTLYRKLKEYGIEADETQDTAA